MLVASNFWEVPETELKVVNQKHLVQINTEQPYKWTFKVFCELISTASEPMSQTY